MKIMKRYTRGYSECQAHIWCIHEYYPCILGNILVYSIL